MKKFTFLLSLLLAFVGVTASAQSLKFSDAPSDGTWASNTQWYLIRVAYTDSHHPKAAYLSTEDGYTNNNGLLLDNDVLPTTDKGLWCIVGNETDGYKFYNKGEGTTKVLGVSGWSKMYDATSTEDVAMSFDIVSSTAKSTAHCVKAHGKSDGDYWWNNGNYNSSTGCKLTQWQHTNSTTATEGNAFYFIPVNDLASAGYDVKLFLGTTNVEAFRYIPGISTACSSELATWEANKTQATEDAFTEAAKAYLGKTYYRITNCNTSRAKSVLAADATSAACVAAAEKMGNASTVWKFVPAVKEGTDQYGVKLYNVNAQAYLGALAAPVQEPVTPMAAELAQGGLYSISVNTNGSVEGFVLRDGNNGRMNLESKGGIDKWEGQQGYYNQVTWTIDVATEFEVALNTVESKSYATAYLPFGVSAVNGAKAYTAATPANGQTVMTETANFAKETGVLLVSDEAAAKAVLTIGDVDGATNSSALKGTLLAKDINGAQTKYLVFGKNNANETEVGFFEPSTTVTSIPANRAFFADAEGSAIALNFGNVTAVNNVVAGNANVNAPIFDLTGRRVVKAVKGGLYIQNGKKYIVK
ncbi:hypothetical protein [Prevotellamassilia timonensis]|uniref:hypothetical protein n=1 Tax=Prevotellamassilia timonensis TaxID=1852370 RepID=UPI00307B8AD0